MLLLMRGILLKILAFGTQFREIYFNSFMSLHHFVSESKFAMHHFTANDIKSRTVPDQLNRLCLSLLRKTVCLLTYVSYFFIAPKRLNIEGEKARQRIGGQSISSTPVRNRYLNFRP